MDDTIEEDVTAETADRPRSRHARLMQLVGFIVIALVVVALIAAVLIRVTGHDADRWHVDPLTASAGADNSYRLAPPGSDVAADGESPVFDRPAAQLAADFDRVALGADRVEVVAGSAAEGFVTYVQRSFLFAFPDYITVRFLEVDDQRSTIALLSRARYGKSDLGVNEKRITNWLAQLD